jgi:16S rRNA (cytosine1402-N4)-methyltransferase
MGAQSDHATADQHTPVLYQHVLAGLNVQTGERYIDGTVGAGFLMIRRPPRSTPDGELLGIDRDPEALEIASKRLKVFGSRVHLIQGAYANMVETAGGIGWHSVHGVLLDLGLSSMQLSNPERGFSFRLEGPIDMRFDPTQATTASQIVNHASEAELADVLWRYGEVRKSRKVAREIIAARPLETTIDLAEVLKRVAPTRKRKIDPATQVFQALRIAVNDELGQLSQGLEASLDLLESGGRLVVISFHSLEDRIVKRFIARESRDCVCPPEQVVCTCGHQAVLERVTKKPIRPDPEEISRNPRARSARLRVAQIL